MSAPPRPSGSLAADVVRAGLDPLTGRTLSFNHVPMAAWAGHLCDLLLAGVLVDHDGVAEASPTEVPPDLHPLVAGAWQHVEPRVPRAWRLMFGPQVVDINRSVADARHWLVGTGVWSRHSTVFGWRYTSTGASPDPAPPAAPGEPGLRRALARTLVGIAQVGEHEAADVAAGGEPPTPQLGAALHAVLTATNDLIAWKTGRPPLPVVGGPF